MKQIVVSILTAIVLSAQVTAATPSQISVRSSELSAKISDILIFESDILQAFWAGDDGIECGEPQVRSVHIDYAASKISFEVIPFGKNYSCEVNSQICEISFVPEQATGSVVIKDSPVLPTSFSCAQ